jgi:hypothetical protein
MARYPPFAAAGKTAALTRPTQAIVGASIKKDPARRMADGVSTYSNESGQIKRDPS